MTLSNKTTREQRRQTLAKLVLGHLIELDYGHARASVTVSWPGTFSNGIATERVEEFPSEELMAKVALALDAGSAAYQSCAINDLHLITVHYVLGEL